MKVTFVPILEKKKKKPLHVHLMPLCETFFPSILVQEVINYHDADSDNSQSAKYRFILRLMF